MNTWVLSGAVGSMRITVNFTHHRHNLLFVLQQQKAFA